MAANTPIPAGAYERLMRSLRADAQRKQFLEQMQSARNAEDMKGRHSVGPDTRRQAHPDLISNALLAGTLGGAMSAAGLPSVGLRAGLIGGGATDAVLNAGNPEGGAEISGGLAAAGALGRHSIPAALAALGIGSSEAHGMPFHSWMKYLKNARGELGDTALYVNPTASELTELRKASRLDAFTNDAVPTVRLMRDMTVPDTTYGWDGTKLLHQDVANHLRRPLSEMQGYTVYPEENPFARLESLRSLQRKAGGGAIKRLGKRAMSQFDELRAPSVAPQGALSVVKNKGGNWLAGSVEDALSPLKEHLGEVDPARLAVIRERLGDPTTGNVGEVLNSWIEGPLTKYVKTRMASPDDEVRKLAEQGVLHFEPRGIFDTAPVMDRVVARRLMSGNPATERAITPLSEDWERYADAAVLPQEAQELPAGLVKNNPWLSKLRPTETVYQIDPDWLGHRSAENLGFNHLIDELSNALNPNSGLPPHLQLTPEAVKQMSMEKAVRRVADINAHRAAKQAAANRELAEKASVVREYTDPSMSNPKGLRWVELKAGNVPEGFTEAEVAGVKRWIDPQGKVSEFRDPRYADLERQLKYEGDTMGHCVGGYCPDVLEGRSRIFSLRDAKGEPHVTVEVAPNLIDAGTYTGEGSLKGKMVTRDELLKIIDDLEKDPSRIEQHNRIVRDYNLKQTPFSLQNWRDAIADTGEGVPKIVQIKGKANRKPNDEYLPFVQDFVRNSPLGGTWGDVGDLHNTGLRRVEDAFNKNEIAKLRAANIPVPEGYANAADIEELHKQFNLLTTGTEFNPARAWERMQYDSHIDDLDIDLPDRAAPMARGGTVTKPPSQEQFQGIIAAIEKELA